ncbi:hypothetical protein [Actinomyces bowdenii]|uniref:Uncharacterized protein n=1 Tax=Actinomyces bowdenii TaxID=131109 RepID=A0A3P1V990_9ACTO|nr:hypothetical protein [Actinomyces bowdenii]RRD30227.1 hypothetical protein EII10_04000 [Actinomyces bowdenii]
MSEELHYGVIALMIGGVTLMNWRFEMFSDSGYAELCRSMMESEFSLGRNTIALIQPAVGIVMSLGGAGMLIGEDGIWPRIFATGALFFLAIAALELIPFRLPKQMYPEWQMEKRRRLATQTASATVDEDPGTAPSTLALKNYQSTPPQNTDHSSSYTLPIPNDELPSRSHHNHDSAPHPSTPA